MADVERIKIIAETKMFIRRKKAADKIMPCKNVKPKGSVQ